MKSTATWANVAIDPPCPSGVIVGVPPLSTDKVAVWSNLESVDDDRHHLLSGGIDSDVCAQRKVGYRATCAACRRLDSSGGCATEIAN